jgi:hypothetical protein
VPEEMYQTLLTNKKQGKILQYQANLALHLPEEIWLFQRKIGGAPKTFKNWSRPFCIHLVTQSL